MGPDDISHFQQTLEVSGLVPENTFFFFFLDFNVKVNRIHLFNLQTALVNCFCHASGKDERRRQ